MEEITLEKIHAMLERMAEHIVNEVPTKKEVDEKFQKVDEKFQRVYDAILELKEEKTDKKDFEILKNKLETLLDGQYEIIKQLDIIRTEQYATSATLDRHEQKLEALETRIDR
ncbi:MAG TPA: hypothetical protein ENN45_00935 [Bacteroidetes bacterium]|nr:hypothetical protein [Bacteroidota bacterium]